MKDYNSLCIYKNYMFLSDFIEMVEIKFMVKIEMLDEYDKNIIIENFLINEEPEQYSVKDILENNSDTIKYMNKINKLIEKSLKRIKTPQKIAIYKNSGFL